MRSSGALLGVLVLSLGRAGCGGNPAGPTPTPSPFPTPSPTPNPYPKGQPDATAFQNLPLIRSLEQASGRQSVLVELGAHGITQAGTVSSGNGWHYTFAERSNFVRLYEWAVVSTGVVIFYGEVPLDLYPRLDITELGPALAVDSNEAARLGRQYGAQAFVDRYPRAEIRMECRFIGRVAVWEMRFVRGPYCELGPIVVSAETGALMLRDLSCLNMP